MDDLSREARKSEFRWGVPLFYMHFVGRELAAKCTRSISAKQPKFPRWKATMAACALLCGAT